MKCIDCEHFYIRQEPYRCGGVCWDMGMAECKMHNLVTEFYNHGNLERLSCIECDNELKDRHLKMLNEKREMIVAELEAINKQIASLK